MDNQPRESALVIGGIVVNGVVVPDSPLPEGMRVEVTICTRPLEFTSEERAEFEAWNPLSDRALVKFEEMMQEQDAREPQ